MMEDKIELKNVVNDVEAPANRKASKYDHIFNIVFEAAPDQWHRAELQNKKQWYTVDVAIRSFAKRHKKRVLLRHEERSDRVVMFWNWAPK